MIPELISRKHVLKTLGSMVPESIPKARRSIKFDLVFGGKMFPPKYVISQAHIHCNGREWAPDNFGGGHETNNFLIARGFTIRTKDGRPLGIEPVDEDESKKEFWEGNQKWYAKHRRIERDSSLARIAKHRRLRATGDLKCDACEFSFRRIYGSRGAGFIEAHHTKPISELKGRTKMRLADMALVCSNCHRMLHRSRPWLSITDLRRIIKSKGAV